jgi:xanthosine utilization system XapX-like protein
MRMLGLLFAAVIAVGIYYFYLKQAAPAPGMVATQAISTTGVEMDLNAIAQAERMYFAQNGSYADLDQLTSSGALTMARSGRDGYTYSIETAGNGFTVTARHADSPTIKGAAPLHYPALSVDQSMQIHQE